MGCGLEQFSVTCVGNRTPDGAPRSAATLPIELLQADLSVEQNDRTAQETGRCAA